MVAKFIHHGFGPEHYNEYQKAFEHVTADIKMKTEEESNEAKYNSSDGQYKSPVLHANTTAMLEGFFTVLGHIYNQDQKFRDDFRVALVRTQESFGNSGKQQGKKGKPKCKLLHYEINNKKHFIQVPGFQKTTPQCLTLHTLLTFGA